MMTILLAFIAITTAALTTAAGMVHQADRRAHKADKRQRHAEGENAALRAALAAERAKSKRLACDLERMRLSQLQAVEFVVDRSTGGSVGRWPSWN